MARLLMTDRQWDLIGEFFPPRKKMGRPQVDRRTVVDGIFWVLRTGAAWRDLPDEFGAWQTVWRLFDQWNGDGTLDKIIDRFRTAQVSAGMIGRKLWCVDGTIVRASRATNGGGKKGTSTNRTITH